MTQQQQIELLSSIMPEINDTHDPKGVMLKCAKKHNLSPAQLEKLGHVYNTAKTLVGLEKQAHRGDSFSIVDVPEMVAEYTDFDPSKAVTHNSSGVHKSVNKLMKYASFSVPAANKKLPSVLDGLLKSSMPVEVQDEGEGNQNTEIDLSGIKYGDKLFKSASASTAYVQEQFRAVAEDAREAMTTAAYNARDAVRSVYDKLLKSANKHETWREMVEDMDDREADRVKTASISHYIESHLEYDHNMRVAHVDLEKRAGKRSIARDRHGIYEVMDELDVCSDMFKEAKALYDAMTAKEQEPVITEKEAAALVNAIQVASPSSIQSGAEAAADVVGLATGADEAKKTEKRRAEAKMTAARQAALQQLILSDPVIAEADPYEVEDIYNTVSSLNDTIASDPKLLGPVIKESLQYKSIPIQMLKDIIAVDKDRQQAVKYKLEAEDLKYKK